MGILRLRLWEKCSRIEELEEAKMSRAVPVDIACTPRNVLHVSFAW